MSTLLHKPYVVIKSVQEGGAGKEGPINTQNLSTWFMDGPEVEGLHDGFKALLFI